MRPKASLSWRDYAALPRQQQRSYVAHGNTAVFALEPSDGWAVDRPIDLRNAVKSERNRNADARKLADILGDVDARAAVDAYNRIGTLEERLRAAETGKGTTTAQVEAMISKATEKVAAERDAAIKKADEYRTGLMGRGLKDELRAAVREVAPHLPAEDIDGVVELMHPHVERRTSLDYNGSGLVVKVLGSDGSPDISGKPGSTSEKRLAELIGDMKNEGPFARLLGKPGAEGFRGSTSPQPAGSRARTANDDTSQPDRVSPMERLKAANEQMAAGHTDGGAR